MSEIPDDIMRVAHGIVRENEAFISFSFAAAVRTREAIARAIMEERERCARIADEYGGGDYWGKAAPIAAAIRASADLIASAIRNEGAGE